ncbi:MAG: GNAT family N-acetyltransferase [Actinomycetota bacterium]|nr:GNAT family N-acetyltransferase [Actinomycetota bacterium]
MTTLADLDWPLHTERLRLDMLRRDQLPLAWRYWGLPQVQEWLGLLPRDLNEFTERYGERVDAGKTLGVWLRDDLVGDLGLGIGDGWAQSPVREQARGVQGELAWCFDPAYGGRGYATESLRSLIGVCFGPLGIRRVSAGCFADNRASWQLMERLGMRREEASIRDSLHHSGRWLDGYRYALLADEWRRTAAGPEATGVDRSLAGRQEWAP